MRLSAVQTPRQFAPVLDGPCRAIQMRTLRDHAQGCAWRRRARRGGPEPWRSPLCRRWDGEAKDAARVLESAAGLSPPTVKPLSADWCQLVTIPPARLDCRSAKCCEALWVLVNLDLRRAEPTRLTGCAPCWASRSRLAACVEGRLWLFGVALWRRAERDPVEAVGAPIGVRATDAGSIFVHEDQTRRRTTSPTAFRRSPLHGFNAKQ
jgi:hypothetical protein